MMWLLYFILTIYALIADIQAKEPVDSYIDNKAVAAREIVLPDDRTAWLHGSVKGSFVTIGGKAAPAGLYSSKDGKVAFTIDNLGYLTAPVTDITPAEEANQEPFEEAMLNDEWNELE